MIFSLFQVPPPFLHLLLLQPGRTQAAPDQVQALRGQGGGGGARSSIKFEFGNVFFCEPVIVIESIIDDDGTFWLRFSFEKY